MTVGVTTVALGVVPSTAVAAPEVLATVLGGPASPRLGPLATRVVVENVGDAGTVAPVTVRVAVEGITSPTASGDGWGCEPFTNGATATTCSRPEALAPGATSDLAVAGTGTAPSFSDRVRVTAAVLAPAPAIGAEGGSDQPQVQASPVDTAITVNAPDPVAPSAPRRFDVRVRNLGYGVTRSPVVVTFGASGPAPEASGVGWICDGPARRCTLLLPIGGGQQAPLLSATTPGGSAPTLSATVDDGERPRDPDDRNDLASGTAVVTGDPSAGSATGDVTVTFDDVVPTRAGEATGPDMVVHNTGTAPVSGPITVRTRTFDLSATMVRGEGWGCVTGVLGSGPVCRHEGPVPAGGTLPPLRWVTTPSGSALFATPVSATVSAPPGADADVGDNVAGASIPEGVVAREVTGRFAELVPATGGRPGTVAFEVQNARPAPIDGPVTVSPGRWKGRDGNGWTCATACHHDGPVPASGRLPLLRGTIVPAATADVQDLVGAGVVVAGSSAPAVVARASVPAARGTRPRLAVGTGVDRRPVRGSTLTATTTVSADRTLAGPVALRLSPSPGLVVESAEPGSGVTCTTAAACTVADGLAPWQSRTVVLRLRVAADGRGPLRLLTRASAADAVPAVERVTVVPVAAGGDLTAGVDGPAAGAAADARDAVVHVRNDGDQPVAGPIEARIGGGDPGSVPRGTGWRCLPGESCVHDGPLAPGAALPDLSAPVRPPVSGDDGVRGVSATVSSRSDDDTVEANSVAGAPAPVSTAAAADLSASLAPTALPTGPDESIFEARIVNVGARATTGPLQVRVAAIFEGFTAPGPPSGDGWSCPEGTDRCVRNAPLAAGEAAPVLRLRRVSSGLTPVGQRRRTATIDLDATSGDRADDHAEASVPEVPGAPSDAAVDLATAITDPAPASSRGPRLLEVGVRNGGSGTTTAPTVVRLTAFSSVGIDAAGEGWACEGGACTTDRRAGPGESLPVLRVAVRGTVAGRAAAGVVTATATTAGDGHPDDDRAVATAGIPLGPVDLSARIDVPEILRAGAAASTVVRVRNSGSAAAPGPTSVTVRGPFGGTLRGRDWRCEDDRCVYDGVAAAGEDLPAIVLDTVVPAEAAPAAARTTVRVSNAAEGSPADDVVTATQGAGGPARSGPFSSRSIAVAPRSLSGAPGDRVEVQVALRGSAAGVGGPATTTVTLPVGLSPLTVPAGEPVPTISGRRLTWDVPVPADDDPVAFTVVAAVDADAVPGTRTIDAGLVAPAVGAPEAHAATFTVVERPRDPGTPATPTTPSGPGTTRPGPTTPGAGGGAGTAGGSPTPGAARPGSPVAGASPSRVRPSVRLVGLRPPRPSVLARSGWSVRVRTSAADTVRVELRADAVTARRLRVRSGTVLASARLGRRAPGEVRVRLRTPAAVRSRVARAARVSGTLRVRSTSASGSASASRRVALRR